MVPSVCTEFRHTNRTTSRLTKKSCQFEWSVRAWAAFDDIKACLTPMLACPDFNRVFTLQTDASAVGIAGVLTQHFDNGEHVVAFSLNRKATLDGTF